MTPPIHVLQHFAAHTRGLMWQRVLGGLSGANVWRGDEDGSPRIALKAWPPAVTEERLRHIHVWMSRAQHLWFMPVVFANARGNTICVEAGRVWDCCRWQLGTPIQTPTSAEIELVCESIAQLHIVWASSPENCRGPCPSVQNRLRILAENEPLLMTGVRSLPPVSPELDPLLHHAATVVGQMASSMTRRLRQWERQLFALQPCIRDLRSEHVLLEGRRVTGVIDFGAMGVDHPAVDLVRLLNDYCCENASLFGVGLTAYRRIIEAAEMPEEFVQTLAESGVLCSVLGWLHRLIVRREPICDLTSICARITHLVAQIKQFKRD